MNKLLFIYLIIFICYSGIGKANEPDYSEAMNKSKDAFLIQSGIQENLNQVGQAFDRELEIRHLKVITYSLFFTAKAYKDKHFKSREFKSPIFNNTYHMIEVDQKTFSLTTKWRFN